jgi:hypothetical protein
MVVGLVAAALVQLPQLAVVAGVHRVQLVHVLVVGQEALGPMLLL